jgi:hypothetical protein
VRWPMPTPEEFDEEERGVYDRVCERQNALWSVGGPGAYFGPLLNSPVLGAMVSDLGSFFKTGGKRGTLPDEVREFADLVCAKELGSYSMFAGHIPDAVAVGVRPQAVDAIWQGNDTLLTEDEGRLATYVRATIAGNLSDDDCSAMQGRYGVRGAMELTAFITFLCMTARLMDAVGIASPSSGDVERFIAGFTEGSAAVPDPTARTG